MYDRKIKNPEVQDWLIRYRYRKQFKLNAQQMDDEPADEVTTIVHIWQMESEREKLEEKRSKQRGQKQA